MEEDIEKRKLSIANTLKKKFFSWVEDKYDILFILVILSAFIIRFIIFSRTMTQPLWWDEATYMATAKRWGLGLNITDVWYYRRAFFWPAFGALFFKLGLGETGIRFSEVIFSTGIIAVSYFLIRDMFDKKLALLVSLGLTFSWVFLFFTGRPMTEIPSAFFLLLTLFFFWKGYVLDKGKKFFCFFAISYAIAVLIRFQHMMFAIPIVLFIFARERMKMFKNKKLWISVGIFLLCLIPFFVLYSMHYGFFLTDIFKHYLGMGELNGAVSVAAEKGFFDSFSFFLDSPYLLTGKSPGSIGIDKIIIVLSLIIGSLYFFMNLFLGIDKIFKDEKVQKIFFVFVWIVIPLIILSRISGLVEQRYVMPVLPFLFLMISTFFMKIEEFATKFVKIKKKFVFVMIFLALILLLIPNYNFGNSLIDNKLTSYSEIQTAGLWIKENSNPGDIIITSSYPQVSYYSERSITTFTSKGNPEEKIEMTQEEFKQFVELEKPKYLILYAYQPHPDWVSSYLQNESNKWIPVKAYPSASQAVLIIYELIDFIPELKDSSSNQQNQTSQNQTNQ